MNTDTALRDLYKLTGERAVLLPIKLRKKGPERENWQQTTFEDTQQPDYQRELEQACKRGGNIGALLGSASGGVIAIDIDSDDEVEAFLTANPKLVGSLRTKGKRGCQIWLRMRGEYPESKILSGLKKGKAAAIEWRGGGGHQSVLWGVHPEKMRYTFLVESPAIEICFEEINWPAHWGMNFSNGSKPASGGDMRGVIGETAQEGDSMRRPCYRVYHGPWHDGSKWRRPGTWFHDRHVTKSGDIVDTDHWICTPLDVLARTATRGDLEHGRLVEFTSGNGYKKRHALPMRLFAGRGDEALGELLSLGLETFRPLQKHVLEYIQHSNPQDRYAAALSTGWHDENTFVLPDEVIGLDSHSEKVWYQGRDQENPYATSGTLEKWQAEVAALASGNPNLIGTICAGLAGPLLFKLNAHGGVVHLFGASSAGKTTALAVGASLWGGGEADGKNKFIRTWHATAVGLEAAAALHSDTLLVVDEIHHVDPKVLDAAVYSLVNGYGKSRGNVHACLRPTARWRVFALSSGEMSSETRLYSEGLIVRGGQAVRMLDVPVEGEHGAFDNLHGFADGAAFSDALRRNALRHHGHAGPAFVRKLIEENVDLQPLLDAAMEEFSAPDAPPLNDLQRRVARTFAIMGLAGELATSWDLLPWKKGEALQSCVLLFRRWQKQMRASASESPTSKIREIVTNFIDRFGDSRFSNIEAGRGEVEPETRVLDRAGYWKDEPLPGEKSQTRRIFLFTTAGLREATKGHDFQQVLRALDEAGAFTQKDPTGKTAPSVWTPRGMTERLYFIDPQKLR